MEFRLSGGISECLPLQHTFFGGIQHRLPSRHAHRHGQSPRSGQVAVPVQSFNCCGREPYAIERQGWKAVVCLGKNSHSLWLRRSVLPRSTLQPVVVSRDPSPSCAPSLTQRRVVREPSFCASFLASCCCVLPQCRISSHQTESHGGRRV